MSEMSKMFLNGNLNDSSANVPGGSDQNLPEDRMAGFPIDPETVISGEDALAAIAKAAGQMKDYREGRLFLFKTIVGPLVPANIREKLEKKGFFDFNIPYEGLMAFMGSVTGAFVLLDLDEKVESVKENQRLLILPFLDYILKLRVKSLEKNKPFGWRIAAKYYKQNIEALNALVDNLVNLAALAWTFCPGIGEPEKETGFYNRFVLTGNGGFIDMGHFFNCAIISYLYGTDAAVQRAEKTEISQRALRENKWLLALREVKLLNSVTAFFWGYATSADTIEDRASNFLGIKLGEYMRQCGDNGKAIEYFVQLYPKVIREIVKVMGGKRTIAGKVMDSFTLFFKRLGGSKLKYKPERVDIYKKMKSFFDEYDAIDPKDGDAVPRGLITSIVKFYEDKYNSDEWDRYTGKEWEVVLPQDFWERVVRGREKFGEKDLPIKVQLKESGKIIEPYEGDAPA